MAEILNKRYPGTRPFQDTDLDRMLFRGREDEKQRLLHLVLSEQLVVLFAKSGVGKTSLLNAGLFESLESESYLPLRIRMNAPELDLMDSIAAQVQQIVEDKGIEYVPGEKESLWQFFKTAEFWGESDQLLTPVLVFDQFEEIFTLDYTPVQREAFFQQLADLVRGGMPEELKQQKRSGKQARYSDSAPDLKIVLSLREDFLANLEEMATEIPSILRNRFRLTALSPEQARRAIEEPAQLENEQLSSRRFRYDKNAITAILNFLHKDHESSARPQLSSRKMWPWEVLGYLSFWIVLFPFLITLFDTSDMIVGALAINWLLIIPIVTLALAFVRPIHPVVAALITLGLHLLNGLMQPITAFIYSEEVDFWGIDVAPFAIALTGVVALICWWRRRRIVQSRTVAKTIEKREIEPFQLQLLCQYIEDKILSRQRSGKKQKEVVVTVKDFGGEAGMEQILRAFYINQVNRVKGKFRRAVRKLCEKGLISSTGRRLSLDLEVIADKYKLPEEVLSQLINFRLLRMEPRLGSYYYEISHDTLVKPILDTARYFQRLRISRVSTIAGILLISLISIQVLSHLEEERRIALSQQMEKLRIEEREFYREAVAIRRSDTLTVKEKIALLEQNQARADSVISSRELTKRGSFVPVSAQSQWVRDNIAQLEAIVEKYATLTSPEDFLTSKNVEGQEPVDITDVFFEGNRVCAWGKVNAPQAENLSLRWLDAAGREIFSNPVQVQPSPNYRFWYFKTFQASQAGDNEVRLYNSQNDLIGRHKFTVQSNIGALTDAITTDTANAKLFTLRGQIFLEVGDVGRAKRDYLTALRVDPKNDNALENLAKLLVKSGDNLVENGSFEIPKVQDIEAKSIISKGEKGVRSIPGWQLSSGPTVKMRTLIAGNAFEGAQFVEMNFNTRAGIVQEISTEPGESYLLHFAVSAKPGYGLEDNKLEVHWDGKRVATLIEDGSALRSVNWKSHRYPLTASAEKTVLEFKDLGMSSAVGLYLDGISVVKDVGQY